MSFSPLLIGFCYAFIAGIASARYAGLGAEARPWLGIASAVAALSAGLWLFRHVRRTRGRPPHRPGISVWAAVLLPALLLGGLRQVAEDRTGDRPRAVIHIENQTAHLIREDRTRELAYLAVRKDTPLEEDLYLRLYGRAELRIAVRDAQGRATLDEEGRWQFNRADVAQESERIRVRAHDPVGTLYRIEQPFSRVDRIEVEGAPAQGRLTLLESARHLSSFTRPGRPTAPVRILGRVTADPAVYGHRTLLPVTPSFIQTAEGGPWFRVQSGDIEVAVRPNDPGYEQLAGRWAYGADIEAYGEFPEPRPQTHPGGFDTAAYLRNHGVAGRMFVRRGGQDDPFPVHLIRLPDGTLRAGSPLVVFSLALRDRLLGVIKQTAPYPSSAFLGGVTLGLRHGLRDARFDPSRGLRVEPPAEADPDAETDATGHDLIFEQFRASGVNHVLAVSGLHVTILTALFAGLFSLARIPRRLYVPLVIGVLVIFAVITGARPSTVRAVIMNSLFLLTWAYLDRSLRGSALLGVPLAGVLILLHNPWMITDPSFTLSFGAILSLALLTPPILEYIEKLRGAGLAAALVAIFLVTFVGIVCWPLLATVRFMLTATVLTGLAYRLARRREAAGKVWFGGKGIADLPMPISAFLAAQIGIQIGMMMPLSAYYFNRWAFAGAYVNLLAIPLIGIVLQLSIAAGLLGFIPGIGLPIALIINAANGLFTFLFLALAHSASWLFPFPFVRRPLGRDLWIWYALLALGIAWRPCLRYIHRFTDRFGTRERWVRTGLFAGLAILVMLVLGLGRPRPEPGMHLTVLPLGYASSILVETPNGRNVLIDTGFAHDGEWRRDDAIRTILPFLSHRRIRRLDAVVLLNNAPERRGGLPALLDYSDIRRLILPAGLAPDETGATEAISALRGSALRRIAGRRISVEHAETGDVLVEETWRGLPFRIEVVHHVQAGNGEEPGLVLRITLGDSAVLLTGDLSWEEQRRWLKKADPETARADVWTVPGRGAVQPETAYGRRFKEETVRAHEEIAAPVLDLVRPEWALLEFGSPRAVRGGETRDAHQTHELSRRFYRRRMGMDRLLETDTDHAVFIHADEKGLRIDTQANRLTTGRP